MSKSPRHRPGGFPNAENRRLNTRAIVAWQIGHALIADSAEVTVDDARFMLIARSAVANYLLAIATERKKPLRHRRNHRQMAALSRPQAKL
jgi:hypothetical protein